MLAAKPKTQRALESIQLLLTFASVCAVVETTRLHAPPHDRPGYSASVPQPLDARGDRRFGDLARVDRKRREAQQHASRRGAALGEVLEQRQLRA
jgi:hypothetical protein